MNKLNNINILNIDPIIIPKKLLDDLPITDKIYNNVINIRNEIVNIMENKDDRIIVVVGPCSIHDIHAAIEYAMKLNKIKTYLSKNLLIIMRTYFEKPRTIIGWKGLINDPFLNNSYDINIGLYMARKLLIDINNLGLPVGVEFLDTISPQYIADLVSWGAIGARTTESQLHRELVSGLSMPIGFKNNTSGNINVAIDAINSASNSHNFLGLNENGIASIVITKGNKNCHIIHRGGNNKTNYDKQSIENTSKILNKKKLYNKVMIDCSHANSNKNYKNQKIVIDYLCNLLNTGYDNIMGVMIESNLYEGKQKLDNYSHLKYGVSVTDSCIGWEETEKILYKLYESVDKKRKIIYNKK